jgi:hypothetical protein
VLHGVEGKQRGDYEDGGLEAWEHDVHGNDEIGGNGHHFRASQGEQEVALGDGDNATYWDVGIPSLDEDGDVHLPQFLVAAWEGQCQLLSSSLICSSLVLALQLILGFLQNPPTS